MNTNPISLLFALPISSYLANVTNFHIFLKFLKTQSSVISKASIHYKGKKISYRRLLQRGGTPKKVW